MLLYKLLYSLFPLARSFDFDLILGYFLTFWASNRLFLGFVYGSETALRSTHVVLQLSFSMIPPILILNLT